PEPQGEAAATKGEQRAGGKAKQNSNDEGATRLCWHPAEKVVLWKAIQTHNPFAHSGKRAVRRQWERVAGSVIKEQDVKIYTPIFQQ
ncbi:unnamed protein product, partial [Ectocarpus sp. 8 AP-2014]